MKNDELLKAKLKVRRLRMNKQEIENAISYWSEFKAEIKDLRKQNSKVDWDEQEKAVNLAIEALEKQIPKKPIEQRYVNNELIGHCPSCQLIAYWQRYCSNCGQKLDWSEEE